MVGRSGRGNRKARNGLGYLLWPAFSQCPRQCSSGVLAVFSPCFWYMVRVQENSLLQALLQRPPLTMMMAMMMVPRNMSCMRCYSELPAAVGTRVVVERFSTSARGRRTTVSWCWLFRNAHFGRAWQWQRAMAVAVAVAGQEPQLQPADGSGMVGRHSNQKTEICNRLAYMGDYSWMESWDWRRR